MTIRDAALGDVRGSYPMQTQNDPIAAETPLPSRWQTAYRKRLVLTDIAVVASAVLAGSVPRLIGSVSGVAALYLELSLVVAVAWIVVLALTGAWDGRVVGRGAVEYRRLTRGSLFLFVVLGAVAYFTKTDIARSYLAIALPLGLSGMGASHALWRGWLGRQRRDGRMLTDVLVVGSAAGALDLARRLQESPSSGYRVIGLCMAEEDDLPGHLDIPLVGTIEKIPEALQRTGASAVAVAGCRQFGPAEVRRLSWQLEGTGIRLILVPSLVDVAGPRIHIKPVDGLPLMQVEVPRFSGLKLVAKKTLDLVLAFTGLLAISPILLCVAIAIKLDDPGPVLFRQTRVGLGGSTFGMWKFRSMHVGAEDLLAGLQSQSQGNGVLFKLRADPRITKLGRFLRRYSIDELPQLFNVLRGNMSLVGPRPPLAAEVALYHEEVHRRFLVRPGLTGLWQVSGRSNLSWDDSVRLDLFYVENWSLIGDVVILARTARAVFGKSGAY